MTKISDLPLDLVEEILSKIPIISIEAVRSTCKPWNALSKEERFTKKHYGKAAKELMMTCDYLGPRPTRFNLHGIDNMKDLPSIKEIGEALPVLAIWEVYQCHGLLLLCVNESRLLVWNPYLGQTRWINFNNPRPLEKKRFAIGYDNDNNFKVLGLFYKYGGGTTKHEIYDFKSSSWRILDIIENNTSSLDCHKGVSLKGNTYFICCRRDIALLICFDFTMKRFGPRLPLPFYSKFPDDVVLSCVGEEQLTVLHQSHLFKELEIWITTKIEPNAVSWSKFFQVDVKILPRSDSLFQVRSFFIDKKKKVAVVSGLRRERIYYFPSSYVVEEDGNYKEIDVGYVYDMSTYVPSPVPIQQ